MVLSYSNAQETDPLALAASMFQPRTTDTFEKWCRDRLGTQLTPSQRMINDSIVQHRYTAVPSCHSAGKSRFAGMKCDHFIDSHTIGSAFVVSTAPTSAQVESVLWREMIKAHTLAGLRGRITRGGYPQWHIGDELVAFGRRPKEVAAFQGVHAKFMLIVIEEADGVPAELWLAVDTLAASGQVHVLAIGNPDSSDSQFAQVLKPGSGWNVVTIDGLLTPNFTRAAVSRFPELMQYMRDHGIPFADNSVKEFSPLVRAEWRAALLDPEWVYERMKRWNVERFVDEDGNPRWREPALWWSKVRGRPPEEGSEGLIPLSWVERAMRRWKEWEASGRPQPDGRLIVGCDIADTGKDETVMPLRRGPVVMSLNRSALQDTETTTERIVGRLRANAGSSACIDGTGMGAPIVNRIRRLQLSVIPYVGASSADGMRDATGEFTFANKRSAAYWHLRELLDPVNGPDNLCIPPDEDLKADLTCPTWNVKTGAVIQVEPKDDVSKRLRRSPDCGDAVVMTFWPDSSSVSKARIHGYGITEDSVDEWAYVDSDKSPELAPVTPAFTKRQRRERAHQLQGELGVRPNSHIFGYDELNVEDPFSVDVDWIS